MLATDEKDGLAEVNICGLDLLAAGRRKLFCSRFYSQCCSAGKEIKICLLHPNLKW